MDREYALRLARAALRIQSAELSRLTEQCERLQAALDQQLLEKS